MAMCAACWMFGSIYSALVRWLVIPLAGWRAFIIVAALPAAVCFTLASWLVPESPRFLITNGRCAEATQEMRCTGRNLILGALNPLCI